MFLAPHVAPADVVGVYALIALIADPEASKKRLDELSVIAAQAEDATKAAGIAAQQVVADQAKAADALQKADVATKTAQSAADDVGRRVTEVAARERDHIAAKQDFEAACASRQADMDKAKSDFEASTAKRTAALDKREADLAAREKEAEALSGSAQALRADYETRVSQLRTLAL